MKKIKFDALLSLTFIFVVLTLLAACSGTESPTSSGVLPPVASDARVLINGDAASGRIPVPSSASVSLDHGSSSSRMKLMARFQSMEGGAPVTEGYCDYSHHQEQMTGGMMEHHGLFSMYDDGTHGDDTAHDGIYCHEGPVRDMMSAMGMPMHTMDEMMGDHEAEFYCVDAVGRESNRVTVSFRVQ